MNSGLFLSVDPISAFAWEPVGHRFACIHGETKINVSFYNVKPGGVVELISKIQITIVINYSA